MMHRLLRLGLAAAVVPLAVAQEAAVAPALVEEKRVAEVVGWLAADERGGRDTPSPGLEAAAVWLGEQFAAAGLEQVVKNSWFHEYTLPGLRVAPSSSAASLAQARVRSRSRSPTAWSALVCL